MDKTIAYRSITLHLLVFLVVSQTHGFDAFTFKTMVDHM